MPSFKIGNTTVSLSNNDFLAKGGEGEVYVKGSTAYKIYTDKSKMIPAGKIQELSSLTNKNVINPNEVILSKSKPIGYTMEYVQNTVPLCKLFTKAYRGRNGLTNETSINLVKNMQNTISDIHKNNILVVDLNEMNFLTCEKHKEVYFIDVDSYQTVNYPATAIMESIRDRHTIGNNFNTGTDWFSFAIVSFQIFVGIHPYKGKHPNLKGFEDRMKNNISVFNKNVNVPKSCLPFDVIPISYKDWYKAVFENGLRVAPPIEGGVINIVTVVESKKDGSSNFDIEEFFECNSEITGFYKSYKNECSVCVDGFRLENGKHIKFEMPSVVVNFNNNQFAVKIENKMLKIFNLILQKEVQVSNTIAESIMVSGGNAFVKSGDNVLKIQFVGQSYAPLVASKVVGNVMPNSTQLFNGIAIQNVLGEQFVSIFTGDCCYQHKLSDLAGYRIVNAKWEHGILMIVGVKKGKYDRFVYQAEEDISTVWKTNDLQGNELNFTVLDSGICVCINDSDEIEVFSNKNIRKVKVIKDNIIHGGMRLYNNGNSVLFSVGKKMFKMKMK